MNKLLTYLTIVVFSAVCITFSACSKKDSSETEKGSIEKFTDQVAEDAVKGINSPINKARSLQDRTEKRLEGIGEVSEQQKAVD